MNMRKLTMMSWFAALLLLAGNAMQATAQRDGRDGGNAAVRGVLKSVDAKAGTIVLSVPERERRELVDKTFTLAKGAEVAVAESAKRGVLKEAKLADIPAGAIVLLSLTADQKEVEAVVAEGAQVRGAIKSVDLTKNTITIGAPSSREEQPAEKTYTITAQTEIGIDDGRGNRLFSIKEGKPADLAGGMLVNVVLSIDQKQALVIVAEGPTLQGFIKSLDGAKGMVTVTMQSQDEPEDRTLEVAKEAVILTDDGKGRRLSVKEVKLADVPVGASVTLKLSPNQQSVMNLRAEGRRLPGLLKSVDPTKGTVTLATFVRRGDNSEEKTYTVAKDARIMFEGNVVKLADVKLDGDGAPAQLQLTLDQKDVQNITVGSGRR